MAAPPLHGSEARLDDRAVDVATLSAVTSRHAYRVIQEALTNVRKHAPGSPASVALAGSREEGLSVTVRNPLSSPPRDPAPTSGLGLTGLAERVALCSGRFSYQRESRQFVLRAWLPWIP